MIVRRRVQITACDVGRWTVRRMGEVIAVRRHPLLAGAHTIETYRAARLWMRASIRSAAALTVVDSDGIAPMRETREAARCAR